MNLYCVLSSASAVMLCYRAKSVEPSLQVWTNATRLRDPYLRVRVHVPDCHRWSGLYVAPSDVHAILWYLGQNVRFPFNLRRAYLFMYKNNTLQRHHPILKASNTCYEITTAIIGGNRSNLRRLVKIADILRGQPNCIHAREERTWSLRTRIER